MTQSIKPLPGVVDATLRQVDEMLAAHRAEMQALVDRIGELSLRDHFAALALQVVPAGRYETVEAIAEAAYQLADAMLRRRRVGPGDVHDTERPPAFQMDEPDTLAPVVKPIGPMVGPGRHEAPVDLRWPADPNDDQEPAVGDAVAP